MSSSAQSKRRGFSVHVFLPGGDPEGIKVVEKDNWNGLGLVVPRVMLAEARSREEIARTGVYVLVGPSEKAALPKIYIGEGDSVKSRIDSHAKEKSFWTHVLVFTSKDQSLNKAHVQHLEARLVELAAAAKRTILDNGNQPKLPSLSISDAEAVESFLDDLLLCLPILGYGFFEQAVVAQEAVLLTLRGKGLSARGHESVEGFVVRKGSESSSEEVASIPSCIASLRKQLKENGVLTAKGDHLVFTQDYLFGSPSTAAAVCLARNANGRIEWKDSEGRSLKKLEDPGGPEGDK